MKAATKKKPGMVVPKPHELTIRERESLEAYQVHQDAKGSPRIKVQVHDGAPKISLDHPNALVGQIQLMDAIGTKNMDFYDGLIRQLADVGRQGKTPEEQGLNFMLAVVKGIDPKDQVEAMLAAQMAAVHNATMTFARRLVQVENIPQQDSAERAFNKLARTFAAQVEALKRYRSSGQQTVVVQHVNVGDGGKAIVGNVINHPAGGRGDGEKTKD